MKHRFSEEEKAEALSRCIDQINEGQAPNLEELGDLGKVIAPLVETSLEVRKAFNVSKPASKERMEEGFSRVRKKYEELSFKTALTHGLGTGRAKLNLARRSDFLVLLLQAAKQVWGNVKLVKLLFLLRNEGEAIQAVGDFYSHYAYNYGAFDDDIMKDVTALKALGVINKKAPPASSKDRNQVGGIFELTPKGEAVAKELIENVQKTHPDVLKDIQNIVTKYGKMKTDELLSYTYKNYPDYAKNSKVKDQYLN